ncbi:hypothetical protein AWB68_05160 [Caballeronia choica]|jgi:hypothetical protein|uniref:DUF1214 domain-containing protein n=2 Tax=Caballeronia choica TaxID=326476 RepID=A0A158K9M4_9BURK|nr:hypothetical protein AWB68_05160 [Caballeronia choica]
MTPFSRSELQNGRPFPSISQYTEPIVNADGSIDVVFSPDEPREKENWIGTMRGRGWFPIFRFYGPASPYFDKTWKLEDIVAIKYARSSAVPVGLLRQR